MRRWIALGFLLWGGIAEAALTQNQYNDHVRKLVRSGLTTMTREASCQVVGWAIDYSYLGVDEQEAARRFIRDYYQAITNIDPATAPANIKHDFTHFINDCRYGEGFAP